ncbi:MAG TPA: hypothetical protein VND91_07080 [Candidatus Saccharimonadia bacterium]|nr:hypothetical protein [Candidatus Saccharimonadia bacterium]
MIRSSALVLALVATLAAGGGSGTPADLATDIKDALVAGDVDKLLATADLEGSPPKAQFPFVKLITDCMGGTRCEVVAKPHDPKLESEVRNWAQRVELELPAAFDGVIEIVGRDANDTAAGPLVDERFAYARVGGQYKVLLGRHFAAEHARLRATTAQAAAERRMRDGIWVPETRKSDTTWLKTAKALPVDGGEPGKAFVEILEALKPAVAAEDVDAAAQLLGDWGLRVLGPTDGDGKPVPLAHRRRHLRMQARRFVVEAKVLGGWQRGDEAIVVIDGVNGAGWIVRGAMKLARVDGRWRYEDGYLIEVPPTPLSSGKN